MFTVQMNPLDSHGGPPVPIPVSEMFHLAEDRAGDVVHAALQHRRAASEGARSALNAAIDHSAIAVPGFRSPSRAQDDVLAGPVLDELLHGNDRLASAVLRTWAESLPGLADIVSAHLQAKGVAITPAKKDAFDAVWPESRCTMESCVLAAENPEINAEDASLMLCYLSGRFPIEVHMQSDLFERFLGQLCALPPGAPEWNEVFIFHNEMTTTIAARLADLSLVQKREFDDAIASIAVDYADELGYLGIDLSTASEAVGMGLTRSALAFAESLRSALETYREVRPQGPTKSEESERAQQRDACEAGILAIVDSWRQTVGAASADASGDGEDGHDHDEVAEAVSTQVESTVSPGEELTAENTRLKWANDALREDRNKLQAEKQTVTAENARLVKELGALRHAHDSLRAEKGVQDEENSTLRRQLRESRLREEAWRGAPVTVHPTGEEPPQPPVESVRDAIAAAEASFPGKLVIALNSRSRDDTPFQRPRRGLRRTCMARNRLPPRADRWKRRHS